jgi:hypothetical protein
VGIQNINIDVCQAYGDVVKVTACIEDPVVIRKNLNHLKQKDITREHNALPESRAQPQQRFVMPVTGKGPFVENKETGFRR